MRIRWRDDYLAWVDEHGEIVETLEEIAARRQPFPAAVGAAVVRAFRVLNADEPRYLL